MNIEVFVLNSFTTTPEGGNPAGVVLNSNLTDEQMLQIAKEVGFSETAFLNKTSEKLYEIRFFTPCAEVDLCGHATIAAFSLLYDKGLIKEGKYTLSTKAGLINISIGEKIFMSQNLPQFSELIDFSEIVSCFDISESDLIEDLPIQVVSTGLRDIILPLKTLSKLLSAKPNFDEITNISKKYNTIGIHAFTLETKFESTAHCRNFAPLYEIPEESATGTANGALACYLYHYKKFKEDEVKNITFEQGYSMNKPSCIYANLGLDKGEITSVNVGGNAILVSSKKLNIN